MPLKRFRPFLILLTLRSLNCPSKTCVGKALHISLLLVTEMCNFLGCQLYVIKGRHLEVCLCAR
jgi:hypothetical protein